MKNFKFLSFLVFITLIFCLSGVAQNVDKKEQSPEEKQNEIEVRKFADSFLDSFIETQDIEKIPQEFFEKDFKKRFVEYSDLKGFLSIENKQFSEDEQKEGIVAFHNFINLYFLLMSSCPIKEKTDDEDDDEDSEKITDLMLKCVPPNIYSKISQSKWLKVFGDDDSDATHPETRSEVIEYQKEMNDVSNFIRNYYHNNQLKNTEYLPQLRRKLFKYYPAEKCEKDRCMGLPVGTEIFAVHQLTMCLRIAKIDGEWKIIQIFSVASE